MRKLTRSFCNLFLGVLTCAFIVGLATAPSFSQDGTQPVSAQTAQFESIMAGGMPRQTMLRFSVNLTSNNVVPQAPTTSAMGMANATLMGDRLVVRGQFSNLSSTLRDYATDPVNPPNPKITSAIHIHRGEATENGPFQFALSVKMSDQGKGGQFSGEYTLSPEQRQALADGKLYIDLHTKQNRTGELRGYFRPA